MDQSAFEQLQSPAVHPAPCFPLQPAAASCFHRCFHSPGSDQRSPPHCQLQTHPGHSRPLPTLGRLSQGAGLRSGGAAALPLRSAAVPSRPIFPPVDLLPSTLSLQSPCLLPAAFLSQRGWCSLSQPSPWTPRFLTPPSCRISYTKDPPLRVSLTAARSSIGEEV